MNKQKAKQSEENARSKEIDDYIALWPEAVQHRMDQTRGLIHATVPDLTEKISWSMLNFQWSGKNLCHFAGHNQYLGYYPGPAAIVAYAKELADYKTSKRVIQLPYTKKLPVDLMTKIILYAKADLEKSTEEKESE